MRRVIPLRDRILDGIVIGKRGECWEWEGWHDRLGYAKFWYNVGYRQRKFIGAYKAVYEFVNGPMKDGLVIDHLCRNPRCVNPSHLEPVTQGVNALRTGPYKKWTHCSKVHALVDGNLKKNGKRSDGSQRYSCKTCHSEWSKHKAAFHSAPNQSEVNQ